MDICKSVLKVCGTFIIDYPIFFFSAFAFLNVLAFALYGIDKSKAKRNKWRIPEASLIGISFLFGSFGALFGMVFFRHKTKHIKFLICVPLSFVIQTLFIILSLVTVQ